MARKENHPPGVLSSDMSGALNPEVVATTPLCVGEVMTRTVITLSPRQSFPEAITLLARHRFRHLLVVGSDQRLAGVISDRDLLRFLTRHTDVEGATVAEVMKPRPLTVQPDTPLSEAVARLLTYRINCLPVVDKEERVCGILTSTDLLQAFQQVQKNIEQTRQGKG